MWDLTADAEDLFSWLWMVSILSKMFSNKGEISALNGLVFHSSDQYKDVGHALTCSYAGDLDAGVPRLIDLRYGIGIPFM